MTEIIAVLPGKAGPAWQELFARIRTPIRFIPELNAILSALDFQTAPLILLDYSLANEDLQACLDGLKMMEGAPKSLLVVLLPRREGNDYSEILEIDIADFLTLDMPVAEIDARLQLLLRKCAAPAREQAAVDPSAGADETFWIWNPQTGMVHVSQALRMIMGGGASLRLAALDEFLQYVPEAERHGFRDTLQTVTDAGGSFLYRYRIENEDGNFAIFTHRLARVSGQHGQPFQVRGVVQITHPGIEHHLPEKAAHQWNQVCRFIGQTVTEQSEAERAEGALTGVVAVNVDRFKRILATCSRRTARTVLHQLEQRFLQHFHGQRLDERLDERLDTGHDTTVRPERPLVARMEGDEYILVFPGITMIRDMVKHAREILEVAAEPFKTDDRDLYLTVSAGISVSPLDGDDGETLLENAHTALMHVKGQQSNRYQFYSPSYAANAREKMALESRLRHALTSDELALFYQPQVDIVSRRIVGVEALVRWQHPEFGLMTPDAFLALAEEAGLMQDIGEWVLKRGMEDAAGWFGVGYGPIQLSVNLSPGMFKRRVLPETVKSALDATGFHPGCLTVELTEELVLEDIDSAIEAMETIRQWGVRFALDDFGTGYSSLNYLKKLPFDYLKIDRSLMHDLSDSQEARAMVGAVIGMGHSLNMKILAEGVETDEQLQILSAENCDLYQGFLCSEAVRSEDLLIMLEKEQQRVPVDGQEMKVRG